MPGKSGNPAARPRFKGLPVPWVARYTDEKPVAMRDGQVGAGVIEIEGEQIEGLFLMGARNMHQDELGIWWCPSGEHRDGHPEFAQVHPERQRRCMDEGRCQVCGQRIKARPLTWLVPKDKLDEGMRVSAPPVCRKCIPMALRYCPHLRQGGNVPVAADAEPWGVYGDVLSIVDGEVKVIESRDVSNDETLTIIRTIAKQRIVTLHGIERVNLHSIEQFQEVR